MATLVLDLQNRILCSDGSVACKYELLLDLARDGVDLSTLIAVDCDGVKQYNKVAKIPIKIWVDDGEFTTPSNDTLSWNTPDTIDIKNKIIKIASELPIQYQQRVELELSMFEERNMIPLIAHIDWMIRDWIQRDVVWGAGRGSSCASLCLYLIGLHEVDPIKYDIPISEFLR
jgi:DNA polymerase III alpha subunit